MNRFDNSDKPFTLSPITKGITYSLIYLTAIYPVHSAIATPITNIVAPNASGISHNTYDNFDIYAEGRVLNNSTKDIVSQLAGQIGKNPNLRDKSAKLIINEVTGGNRSNLSGQLEIAGDKASVLIANPNGITCDGCGFINTASAMLTTGKPKFDEKGALEFLSLTKGQIIIGNNGLNAQGTDSIDIISRALELNGKIQANNLNITQGTNRINYKEGTITSNIAGEGQAPQVSIDTKALGGMYANKIHLVSTENGVGVNLANLESTQEDITLSSNGKIALASVKAKTDLNVTAQEINIKPNNQVQAQRDILLTGDKITNAGGIITGQDMRIYGNKISNIGTKAIFQANNNMWIQKNDQGDKSNLVENKSGTIKTNNGDLVVRTKQLNNIPNYYFTKRKLTQKELDRKKQLEEEEQRKVDYCKTNPYDISTCMFAGSNAFNSIFDHWEERPIESGRVLIDLKPSDIASGNNIYINSDNLINDSSNISAEKDIFLTGKELKTVRYLNSIATDNSGLNALRTNPPFYSTSTSATIPASTYIYYTKGIDSHDQRNHKTIDWYNWNNNDIILIEEADDHSNYLEIVRNIGKESSGIHAKGNIVADFSDKIYLNKNTVDNYHKTFNQEFPAVLSAKNIVLTSKVNINVKDKIKSIEDTTIISENNINILDTSIYALKDISIMAVNNIRGLSSKLIGKNINLNSYKGDITFINSPNTTDKSVDYEIDSSMWGDSYYSPYGQSAELSSSDNLNINSGYNLKLKDVIFSKNKHINLTANNDISISDNILNSTCTEECNHFSINGKIKYFLSPERSMKSTDSINIASGGNITLKGLTLSTDGDIFLNSIKDISLIPKNKIGNSYTYNTRLINHEGRPSDVEYSPTGFAAEDFGTRIFTKNGIISSGGNIFGNTVQINTKNNLLIRSGNNIKLAASDYENRTGSNATNKFETTENISISNIHTSGNLTLLANNVISMVASKLSTGGDMNLSAGGSIGFEATNAHTKNFHISESGGFYETISDLSKITPRTVELSSSKNLSILTEGNILFQATKLMAKGAMNIAAKGGYLYAQAQEDISHYTTKSSSRNWYGKKKTSTHVHHEVHNRVTEFIAEGDINLLSHDDSTYEASKIETSKNATLTSTHGKINFKAVKDTIFDQVISQSKGFFIKNQDKGYSKETWVLPSVHIRGKLTIEAAEGITADVKVKNKEILQNTLDIIGNTPETAWLKELSKRQDVHWNEVQDAYSSWNYENKSLNPVVSAAIAIAVAAVTAGAGLTLTAAGSAATTAGNVATAAGASATTAATVSSAAYGAVQTGMAALASKAAVSLINNEGDLSKTLKDMGNSKTVKSIATSMVIGGALSGFDQAMGWTQAKNGAAGAAGTNEARLPLLSNKDWIQTAQRVAGQSIISSSLNTAINRGSFKDNFTTALLSTTANQIHAEGAHQIGNYFDSKQLNALEEAGRAISHAGLSALAAEISGGDAKGAAAGALATSLAYAALGNTFEDPLDVQASGKIIGGVAGAFISNSAAGAYSGADAGEITIIYNGLAHSLAAMKAQDPEAIKNWEKGVSETCSPNPQLCQEAAKIVAKEASEFIPGYRDIKAFHDAETTNDYLVATLGILPAAKVVKVLNKLSKAVDAGDVKTAKKIITEAKTEAVSVKYFGQDRKYWKDEPISFEHGNVKNKVYQRNDLFDPHAKDPKGRTNIERMKTVGLAPVGADGKSITLHHMTQKHTGPIAEINQEFHSKNTKVIHVNTNKIPSGIDRNKFNKWKREYWKERAKEFEDKK